MDNLQEARVQRSCDCNCLPCGARLQILEQIQTMTDRKGRVKSASIATMEHPIWFADPLD